MSLHTISGHFWTGASTSYDLMQDLPYNCGLSKVPVQFWAVQPVILAIMNKEVKRQIEVSRRFIAGPRFIPLFGVCHSYAVAPRLATLLPTAGPTPVAYKPEACRSPSLPKPPNSFSRRPDHLSVDRCPPCSAKVAEITLPETRLHSPLQSEVRVLSTRSLRVRGISFSVSCDIIV